jgi:bloom syndrome protein
MNNKKIESVLKSVFGFSSLRPFQQKVAEIAFSGNDILILSPTGSGKSLCYQLPSLIDNGMTLVISPLRSLIHDQVTKLNQLNVPVAVMTGDVSIDEKKEVNNNLSKWDKGKISCPYKLFYTTPEMITYNKTVIALLTNLYKKGYLSRVVIDEAHCVSTWGHDFRDSYLTLGQIRNFFPKTPIMALTATATPKVKKDIIYLLDIPKCTVLSSSFRRHNLKLEIIRRDKNSLMDMRDMIVKKFNGQSGIVYCHSRKDCERISDSLSRYLNSDYYHAGLESNKRKQIQNDWIQNKLQVIVATIAFGMGVDKPDVRFVIHYNMPMSVENYYQEIGRAGRDGRDSTCILYFSYSDKILYEKIIRQNIGDSMSDKKKLVAGQCQMLDTDDEDSEDEESEEEVDEEKSIVTKKITAFQSYQLNKLYDMMTYIENITDCRHVLLSNYFGENIDLQEELCHTYCNNCLENLGKIANKDLTEEAGFLCQIIMEISHKNIEPTRKNVIDSFTAQPKSYNVMGYGKGKTLGKEDSERLLSYMIREKFIKEDLIMNKFNYWIAKLTLRKRSKKIITGKTKIILPVKESLAISSYFEKVEEERLLMKERIHKDKINKKKSRFAEEDGEDTDYKNDPLYDDLQKFRIDFAKNNNMPLYRVFDNKTLRDLVLKKPANEKELGNVYGIATKRIQEYGDEILNVIALGWDSLNDIKQS